MDTITAVPDLTGEAYYTLLARIHDVLRPATYLEIGTYRGDSLRHAKCPSIAVDPSFELGTDVTVGKEVCHLYRMPSDRFFAQYDPLKVFGRTIDFAFLDGMHLYEFLLRDFANVERCCQRNSIIAMHDCIPTDAYIASRIDNPAERETLSTRPGWWTGDVWKAVLVLRKYRPDLHIHAVDAPPTGLILITNLDPSSDVLSRRHFDICREFDGLSLVEYGVTRLHAELSIVSTAQFQNLAGFSGRFWL